MNPPDGLDWNSLDIPQISKDHLERLEEPYSEKEFHRALLSLNKGKAPGSDGLTVDFYTRFWDLLKAPLLKSLDFGLQSEELSTEQKRAIVTLIPKKGVDRRRVKNWRPISLLNTDNKILTKAMSLRLQPVLKEIIHADQTGFLQGRYIGESLRSIQDVIDFSRASNSPAILLALDFRKAFDSVSWQFILRAFEEFGFGDNFVSSIKTIFCNIQACIANSGFTSNYFAPSRGVRQGCCVSPYLFLVAVEILAIQIRQNPAIRGISVGSGEACITQFADDLTGLVSDRESAVEFLSTIECFGRFSGLVINKEKSHLLPLGPPSFTDLPSLGLKVVERTKILGLWFAAHRSLNDHYEWNYKETLARMRTICSSWHNRHLSLKGKVVVFNSLVVSLLHYVAANSELPNRVLYELKRMVTHFLWSGGSPKVAYSTLVQPIEAGGLKLVDFSTRIQAAKLAWIKRLVLSDETFSRQFVEYLSEESGFCFLTLGKPQALPLRFEFSPFYSETFKIWLRLHGFCPSLESQVRWEVLWNNRRISIKGAPFVWKSWWLKGIMRVEDILHPSEGRFLSHLEIFERYGIHASFLDVLQLRQSLPGAWRALISPHGRPPDEAGLYLAASPGNVLDLFTASSLSLYNALIINPSRKISAQAKWDSCFSDTLTTDDWALLYRIPFRSVRETKMQALQFKIFHRIVPCRKYLKTIRVLTDDTCAFCPEQDTLCHFLYDCPETSTFWGKIIS